MAARRAAQLRALEAGAPALAAAATCPLRAADLLRPDVVDLLKPVIHYDFMQASPRDGGLDLHEARLVYRGAAVCILASIVRRILWRDVLAWLERGEGGTCLKLVMYILLALCTMLKCPFFVRGTADRRTAVREAAVRCARDARAPVCRLLARRAGRARAHHLARLQVRGVRRVRLGSERGHIVGGASGEQPGQWGGLRPARHMRAHAGGGTAAPRGRPALHRLPPSQCRVAQVVYKWCEADALEALGGAAVAPSSVLAPYFSGLCAVLVWLAGAPALPPALVSTCVPEAADYSDRTAIFQASCQVRARPLACSPRRLRMCGRPQPGLPQHLATAPPLFGAVRDEALRPTYLKAFCSAPAGDLLVSVLEQGLFGACGARPTRRAGGALAAGRARAGGSRARRRTRRRARQVQG